MSSCGCGAFPGSVIDTAFSDQPTNTVVVTTQNGVSVTGTSTTDSAGNTTQNFDVDTRISNAWTAVTAGASGASVSLNSKRVLLARIDGYSLISATENRIIRLSGVYGYTTPVVNTLEHICTLPASHRPAVTIGFPIMCYGHDLANDITEYAHGYAEIRSDGQVHAMFTDAVPAADGYAIELNLTFQTEA